MKVALLVLFVLVVQVYSKTCDPTKGLGLNPGCDDKKEPYSRVTVLGKFILNPQPFKKFNSPKNIWNHRYKFIYIYQRPTIFIRMC